MKRIYKNDVLLSRNIILTKICLLNCMYKHATREFSGWKFYKEILERTWSLKIYLMSGTINLKNS